MLRVYLPFPRRGVGMCNYIHRAQLVAMIRDIKPPCHSNAVHEDLNPLFPSLPLLNRGLSRPEGGPRAGARHVSPLHSLRFHAAHLGEIHQNLNPGNATATFADQ